MRRACAFLRMCRSCPVLSLTVTVTASHVSTPHCACGEPNGTRCVEPGAPSGIAMLKAIASVPRDALPPTVCSLRDARSARSGGRRAAAVRDLVQSASVGAANAELASSAQRADSAYRMSDAARRRGSRRLGVSRGYKRFLPLCGSAPPAGAPPASAWHLRWPHSLHTPEDVTAARAPLRAVQRLLRTRRTPAQPRSGPTERALSPGAQAATRTPCAARHLRVRLLGERQQAQPALELPPSSTSAHPPRVVLYLHASRASSGLLQLCRHASNRAW
jgi:hypothetical protein